MPRTSIFWTRLGVVVWCATATCPSARCRPGSARLPWTRRDLAAKRYVYVWADGIYFQPRLDHDKQCLLVIIGADAIGEPRMSWV